MNKLYIDIMADERKEILSERDRLKAVNAELLAALEFMVERGICTESVMNKARAAISRAKGE